MMSATCHCKGFVENAWRKELCSNCFRVRDEHEINSVKSNGYLNNSNSGSGAYGSTSGLGLNTGLLLNGSSSTSALVPSSTTMESNNTYTTNNTANTTRGRYQTSCYTNQLPTQLNNNHTSNANKATVLPRNSPTGKSSSGGTGYSSNSTSSSQLSSSSANLMNNYIINSNNSNTSKLKNQHPSSKSDSNLLRNGHLTNSQSHYQSGSGSGIQVNNMTSTGSGGVYSDNGIHNSKRGAVLSYQNANNTTSNLTHQSQQSTHHYSKSQFSATTSAISSTTGFLGSSSSNTNTYYNTKSVTPTTTSPIASNTKPSNGLSSSNFKSSSVGTGVTFGSGLLGSSEKIQSGTSGSGNNPVGASGNSNYSTSTVNVKKMDVTDGDLNQKNRKPKFNVGGLMRNAGKGTKGILKKDGNGKRKMNVRFPEEVVKVIGYGGPESKGDSSCSEDDEDLTPADPQDSSSIAEILEKNSTSFDEKEFHRLTQKNTNFNSIKTNLQGKTNIEIGPIVGCTGGKSMENASKPLVSIGTFESRNEPLRIRKKIDEDSTEDELNQKTVEKNRKFVPRSSAPNSTNSVPNLAKNVTNVTTNISSSSSASSLPKVPSQPPQQTSKKDETDEPKSQTNSTAKAASYSVKSTNFRDNSNSVIVVNGTNTISHKDNNYNSKAISNIEISGTTTGTTKQSQSAISNIEVNPNKSKSNFVIAATKTTIGTTSTLVKSESETALQNQTTRLAHTAQEKPALKPKSILKNSQNSQPNLARSTTDKSGTSPLTNLIILTDGSNITSKRTSFLKDIIVEGQKVSNNNGVTIVNTSVVSKDPSLESPSLEKDSLEGLGSNGLPKFPEKIKPEITVDFNEKLTRLPFIGTTTNNGTDSEFDDSLEDSGLDIGKTNKEISESDEKSGSSSDSGNENDYSDRDNRIGTGLGNNQIPPVTPGLFISVEDEEEDDGTTLMNKPAKLSPDSVLFSSASEMSASGSAESIPEVCESGSHKSRRMMPIPTSINTKRPAPRPPRGVEDLEDEPSAAEIYANQVISQEMKDEESELDEESFYDDVSNFKNGGDEFNAADLEEESIYDDCITMNSEKGTAQAVTGSYNFHDGSRTLLDTDGQNFEDEEQVITRRSDGIEFIGIRKIDSETFLRERSPSPDKHFGGKRERSSSTSPKTRRKVNQFFSTIGKKAGAAFSNSQLANYTSRNKSPVALGVSTSPTGEGDKRYKRSMSTDEVSASRTQEIYATLTPTSLKFKNLAPVLHKLSKIDLTMNDKNKGDVDDSDSSKEKMFQKKNKISTSIKKFLRFGNKDQTESSTSSKYDFSTGNLHTGKERPMMISAPYHDHQQITSSSEDSSSTPSSLSTDENPSGSRKHTAPVAPSAPMGRPPPPPPRVHSLDLLNKVGLVGPNGTVKPARPPPPVRSNKVAPSFTSVFSNSGGIEGAMGNLPDVTDMTPPNKPRRKNSLHHSGGVSRDLETTYNHIANLNLETLGLIANQPLTKISTKSPNFATLSQNLKWSQIQVFDPMTHGTGFALFSAQLEGQECVVLIQECTSAPGFSAPFQFSSVQSDITFDDVIPTASIPWETSDYVKTSEGIKSIISVMPPLSLWKIEDFVRSSDIPIAQKYLALLQVMDFWGSEDLLNLLVLKQKDGETNYNKPPHDYPEISSTLVYIHSIPQFTTFGTDRRSSSKSQLHTDFEVSIKQLLLTDDGGATGPILTENDRQVLLQKVCGSPEEVQAQLKLFFQLKLFVPSKSSDELSKIRKYRSEQAVQQWLDKERALCMKEAIEISISRNSAESITPFKKSYLEFLMKPGNSAKAILEMFVELFE